MDTNIPTNTPANSGQEVEMLTLRQLAIAYQVSKQAIAQRVKRLPPDAVTLLPTDNGKLTLVDRKAAIKAWGAPPAQQDTHNAPYSALVDGDGTMPTEPQSAPQSAESASTTTAEAEQLRQLHEEIEALRQELAEAKQETAEALKRAEDLADQLKASDGERERLQIQLDGLGAGVDLLTRERNTLAASIDTLTAQLAAKDLQIDQLHQLQLAALRAALPAPKQSIFARIFGRKKANET